MAETLTLEQRQAVENRGGKLLVSAAAGSGKTKVLVDRLMSYILDPMQPANIDDFLIITYTKAAASELRGKIAAKISELIASSPSNRHLQQQMQRLYLAKISTVHGFCGDLLRQYAYLLDIPADFRVADEGECLQLQIKALDQVLNNAYESEESNPDFYTFVDSQGLGRDDRQIPEIILKVYNSARCHLHPDKWLDWCIEQQPDVIDAGQTLWGKFLIDDLHQYLSMQIDALNRCVSSCVGVDGMEKPAALFLATAAQLQVLCKCKTWDEIVASSNIDFGRLTFPKNCTDLQLAEQMKAVRNACKDGFAKRIRSFSDSSEQILRDMHQSLAAARGLVMLVRMFSDAYSKLKRNRGILDFGDLEQLTLDLLWGKQRSGITKIAAEIGDCFREVMVDEYQDSNQIQDAIFSALTDKRQNCFMVGDVKQSIYQFRLADPDIFIEKYNSYENVSSAKPRIGRKVLLSHNFRSSGGVISAVNDVFSQCMSAEVGGLYYGEEEKLREGIPHILLNDPEVTLYGIDVEHDTYTEEADFVAGQICSLLDGTHSVRDGDKLRPVQPEDIVILLRSPGSVGSAFQFALQRRGIRCITGESADLLHTDEVDTVRSILQVINNPLQDIPLVAVMTSPVFGFTAEELAQLRSGNRTADIFHLLSSSKNEKCSAFINILNSLRKSARLLSVTQILGEIYTKTNILSVYSAMPDGEIRYHNLQMFFQIASDYETSGPKELGRFLEFLDASEERGLGGAVSQQDKGAVTIMSIHKSKGLEFPVVFLCGLSRGFNQESARAQVLCHKDLGLGLGCTDVKLRVRYPTIAKRAISTKIIQESISEEMRVLYVAMTRARDRLFMTYAVKNLSGNLQEIAMRLDMSNSQLLASEADCPGAWILQSALTRTEAGAFFEIGGKPNCSKVRDDIWKIETVSSDCNNRFLESQVELPDPVSDEVGQKILDSLKFDYLFKEATEAPSKLTATQLKGRLIDTEISEGTEHIRSLSFRKAGQFAPESGISYGNAMHAVLQYICFSKCSSADSIRNEVSRLMQEKLITAEQANLVDCGKLFAFFNTPLGRQIQNCQYVIREFKFSILDDASKYYDNISDEKILLQGVVDCALIEDDGIVVLDFKTDRITEELLPITIQKYKTQVCAYANALTRIYDKPVKSAMLYFFELNRFVEIM